MHILIYLMPAIIVLVGAVMAIQMPAGMGLIYFAGSAGSAIIIATFGRMSHLLEVIAVNTSKDRPSPSVTAAAVDRSSVMSDHLRMPVGVGEPPPLDREGEISGRKAWFYADGSVEVQFGNGRRRFTSAIEAISALFPAGSRL